MNLPDFDKNSAPADVLAYPSMMKEKEKSLLYWLAQHHFRGDGIIVDAGIFLGASTYAFARGLKQNSTIDVTQLNKPIHSYDIAIWTRSMSRFLSASKLKNAVQGQEPEPGESFANELKRLLGEHSALVDFRLGDIIELAHTDRPVEIAFYDCLKTNERDFAAHAAFTPHLIPSHSIVIQQDYFYENAPYNKIRQEYLSNHFEFLGEIDTSAIFLAKSEIPAGTFLRDTVSELPISEKIELLRQAARRSAYGIRRYRTELSAVTLLQEHGEIDGAKQLFGEIKLRCANETHNERRKLDSVFAKIEKKLIR